MAKIRRIQPEIPVLYRRKRTAAYARVSMETDGLLHSLSAQVSYYSNLIQSNPDWEYAGVYIDEGITGTSTKHRDDFKRLIDDCEAGLIDQVIVKSISRFARDTLDTLKTTRRLKELGIDVYFERERIHSMSDEGELMLTLLASYAQEESRSISENVKWGIRKRFKEGIPCCHKEPYGYRWDGEMFRIIPEQGEIVKEIYSKYLDGMPAYSIMKDLKERGVLGQTGVPMDDSTIKNILSSISYTGVMELQKNFFTEEHVRKRNRGELPRYLVEGMFEPLVSEEDFEKAQEIMNKRALAAPNRNPKLTPFSGKMKCGICGCSISRRTHKNYHSWLCNTKERKGKDKCNMVRLAEKELIRTATMAVGLDEFDGEDFKRKVALVIVFDDHLEFRFKNGKVKSVDRQFKGSHKRNGYTGKVKCGDCGSLFERDVWKMGPAGDKQKYSIWKCKDCGAKRLMDDELRSMTREVSDCANYEIFFIRNIDNAIVYENKLKFIYKDGTVRECKRE